MIDPTNPLWEKASTNNGGAITHPTTGDIFYNDLAFNNNYDKLKFIADHEFFHRNNILSGKFKGVKMDDVIRGKEEWSVWKKNYMRQGLYPKSGITTKKIINNINAYGNTGEIYESVVSLSRNTGISTITSTKFETRWWHSLYKIPRRW